LQGLKGTFYVVIYPEGIETILIIVAIGIAAAAIGLSFLLRPHATTPNIPNQQNTSPNNNLADRQNTARANERIPDIFGKLWSTPDLIAVPYRIFIAGVETEYCYMCIGRGSYTIDQIREDITPVAQITGTSVEIYGPFTSPNSGDAPVLRVGAAIGTSVINIKASKSVNGQVLMAPNLAGAGFSGAFLVGDATTTDIWANFTAGSGSYSIDGTTGIQSAVTSTVELGITPVDSSGTPTAAEAFTTVNVVGSATQKELIGVTLKVHLTTPGMSSVRAKRTTNTTIAANISVSDEVKWRDCYAVSPIVPTHFGNVTTVQTVATPTPQALAIQTRKLNLLVTRNIPIGSIAGGVVTFAPAGPTSSAADVLCAMAQDIRIGNRSASEIDFVGIYTTINAVATYFGTTLATEFHFSFDNAKVSFEEAVADIAAAICCEAYRRGSLLTLSFEKLTANSTILFNHRNKIPNSETRTVTFGFNGDIDGIDFTYTEPNDPLSPNQDVANVLSFPLNIYHIHCTGGTSTARYLLNLGVSVNLANYVLQCRVHNTGVLPVFIFDAFLHSQVVAAGTTVDVNLNFTGDGSTSILFQIVSNAIADDISFNISNLYIANLADGINLVPVAQRIFSGASWGIVSGTTVTVSLVAPTAVNPKQITSVGIRNNVQAYLVASRLYNKLLYQNTVVEFQGLEEAALLVLNDRILVADNTRSDTQDGEVQNQIGLLLTLSQPVKFVGGRTYTIFLQHYDETVESIGITQPDATKPTQVLLAGAPSLPLVIDPSLSACLTTYQIVDNTPQRANAFLLSEKTPQTAKTYTIKAASYDNRYYFNDVDFIKGFVVSNGSEGTGTVAIGPGGTYRPSNFNNLNSASGSTILTSNSGSVKGFKIGPPSPDTEIGDVIWNGFAPVKISANTTLSVVVSGITGLTKTLILNGTSIVITAAGTYTVVIPANTYLSSVVVEAQVQAALNSTATIVITDIFIT
jgi:hypothetical protein